MNALTVCLVLCGVVTAATWLASVITREHSWVDRIWSIAPIAYAWILAAGGAFAPRLVLMAGRPGEREAALKSAGVDAFIFAGQNAVEALRAIQQSLGVGAPSR